MKARRRPKFTRQHVVVWPGSFKHDLGPIWSMSNTIWAPSRDVEPWFSPLTLNIVSVWSSVRGANALGPAPCEILSAHLCKRRATVKKVKSHLGPITDVE